MRFDSRLLTKCQNFDSQFLVSFPCPSGVVDFIVHDSFLSDSTMRATARFGIIWVSFAPGL